MALLDQLCLQVYMDSMNDLLWEEQMGARPKLEVRIGAHGSHLPSLVEKQVSSVGSWPYSMPCQTLGWPSCSDTYACASITVQLYTRAHAGTAS